MFKREFHFFKKYFFEPNAMDISLSTLKREMRFSLEVVWQLVRQLIYAMFRSNNSAWFHLWCKENLVKHQKASKYHAND